MKVKYGFVEFYDKEDKVVANFFKDANNRDILGLRKMNVRMSNVLFPFGNTLMPNLVYIYYLNAIYHVLQENGRLSAPQIDEWEKKISQRITKFEEKKEKGFIDTAKIRAFARYKSNMERMHFFDKDWRAEKGMAKSALELLKGTKRYEFVKKIIENGAEEINLEYEYWVDKLEDKERLDYIRRVVLPYENETPRYSVFANIVMSYCHLKQKPNGTNTIYRDDWMEKTYNVKYKDKKIELGDFDNLNLGNVLGEDVNRKKDYEVALLYSKLQRIAKHAYNLCLFENNELQKSKYEKALRKEIKFFKKKWSGKERDIKKYFCESKKPNSEYKIFVGKVPGDEVLDNDLKSAFHFIYNVAYYILKSTNDDELVDELKKIVVNREEETMGDDSILGSGIQVDKPRGDYVDTFRWQYRPEYQYEDGKVLGIDVVDTDEEEEENNNSDKKVYQPMSASYYIYELFYEPYEIN